MNRTIIIGTRGSELALWQARYAQNLLFQHHIRSELKIILTLGDKNQQWQNSFDKLEGKNFFTKEIEESLLNKEIDLAVHSFKDVEATFFENTDSDLMIAGLSERYLPNDILILHSHSVDKTKTLHIKSGARIGTSSARRYAQLKTLREDIEILPLRGNVPTRIQKLKNTYYDGILLAKAGVERLNIDLSDFYVLNLPLHLFVPAAGQGIIAFQIRKTDEELFELIQKISHKKEERISKIERQALKWMGGGCSKPVGILCEEYEEEKYRLYVSCNTDKNDVSVLSVISANQLEELSRTSEKNIQNIKKILNVEKENVRQVFISKKLDEESYFKKVIRRLNWGLADEPLIQTRAIAIDKIPDYRWIFFNSKNAVKYFFDLEEVRVEEIRNKKIACISAGTAEYVERYGFSSHFIGDGTDISQIAQAFAACCKDQRVIFPCSTISIQNIEKAINYVAEVIHFPVYETIELSKKWEVDFDYLIFTSPSNARAFLKSNSIALTSKMIAMGERTKRELIDRGVLEERIALPVAFDEVAMVGAMMGMI